MEVFRTLLLLDKFHKIEMKKNLRDPDLFFFSARTIAMLVTIYLKLVHRRFCILEFFVL
jgi:hypothetical protein